MIERHATQKILKALNRQAAVALLGPRQVGKTTLAHEIALRFPSLYLDLESEQDRNKLQEPRLFLERHFDKLIILDEIHRLPEIFRELRGIIDERRRQGKRTGQFLILGSAAIELLKQSSQTLAGRIEFVDLGPLNLTEVNGDQHNLDKLWLRGGFPDSFLSLTEDDSAAFRNNFIQTYLERDIPMFGPRIPAETLKRLWMMLAHSQGALLNSSKLAASLAISSPTVTGYIDLLVDLLLVRRLNPFIPNIGKRLVKSPKIYVRDSGLLHSLLGISSFDDLMGHPIVGASWEGFVIENILSLLPKSTRASFYRTSAGAEVDLVLENKTNLWLIEIKRSLAPKLEKGFQNAIEDLKPEKAFIVYPGDERYPKSKAVDVISLPDLLDELKGL